MTLQLKTVCRPSQLNLKRAVGITCIFVLCIQFCAYFRVHGSMPWKSQFRSSKWNGQESRGENQFYESSKITEQNNLSISEFREFTSIFVPRNGIPSYFLFRGMVRNSQRLLLFLFHGTEVSEHISLSQNGSEQNSESLLQLFHCTEFQAFSLPRNNLEFREFSVPRNSRNSAGTTQFLCLCRLQRNIFVVGNCLPLCRTLTRNIIQVSSKISYKGNRKNVKSSAAGLE